MPPPGDSVMPPGTKAKPDEPPPGKIGETDEFGPGDLAPAKPKSPEPPKEKSLEDLINDAVAEIDRAPPPPKPPKDRYHGERLLPKQPSRQ